jgi:integrase
MQRGQVDRTGPGKWRLRWYESNRKRRSKQPFSSRSAAWTWFRENVEPSLQGAARARTDATMSELVALYLKRHSGEVRPRTIQTLRERLGHAERRFGDVPLRELERMVDEIAAWHAQQPAGVAYGRMAALRQTLAAAVRWGYMESNPAEKTGRNRQPPPRPIRVYSDAELRLLSEELSPMYRPLPVFAAATGVRPEEWQALERPDIDWSRRILNVRRTVSLVKREGCESNGCQGDAGCKGHPGVVEMAKNDRSRRQVPLSQRATDALEELVPRLDPALLFPSPSGDLLRLDNFRSREWNPAVEASGIQTPARIYDLRSTYASTALAAGISSFELARVMGNSQEMIERHYGTLLDGSAASITRRLDAFDAERSRAPIPEQRDATG